MCPLGQRFRPGAPIRPRYPAVRPAFLVVVPNASNIGTLNLGLISNGSCGTLGTRDLRARGNHLLNQFLRAAALGVAFAAGPIAVLAHGLLDLGAIFTGLVLVVPVLLLASVASWREIRVDLCDILVAAFAGCIVISCLLNGVSDRKELALLAVVLAQYAAGRLAPVRDARSGLLSLGVGVVVIGIAVTIVALVEQWSDNHGKPYVFGEFDAAPTQFAVLLGVVVIAAVSSDRLPRWTFVGVGLLSVVAVAVFSASMVRFSLLALVVSAGAGALFCKGRARRRGLVLVALLIVAIGAGAGARWGAAAVFGRHLLTATGMARIAPDASMLLPVAKECPPVDVDNSLAIRKQLLADAVRLLPQAGPFGVGAGGFALRSCVRGHSVHNSFIQAVIEFGWFAGALLVAVIVTTWHALIPLARVLPDYRFAACLMLFVVLISMVHGRTSHDFILLLVLGLAAHLRATRESAASQWMLRGFMPLPSKRAATSSGPSGS